MKIKDKITTKKLKELYLSQKMSSSDIAKIFHCDPSYVRDLLKKYKIEIRTISEAIRLRFNVSIPEKELRELYLEKKLSSPEIARIYQCNHTTIRSRLRECGARIRTLSEATRARYNINVSKKELIRLYSERRMSSPEIAKVYRCSPRTIRALLKQYGIKIRTKSEAIRLFYDINVPKKELKKLYLEKKISSTDIAKKFKCNPGLIINRLREYKIPIRSIQEAHLLCNKPKYPQYDFSGDLEEKAYLMGFRQGDLNAYKRSEKSASIFIQGASTKQAFHEVVEQSFVSYGRIWRGKPNHEGNVPFHCSLNQTFNFLLPKQDLIEPWILEEKGCFAAFLAGYADAEGSFCLCGGNAVFSIRSQDKQILNQISAKLIDLGILLRPPQVVRKKGTKDIRGTICTKDIWGFWVHRKDALIKLIELLKPYSRHADKKRGMDVLIDNITWRNNQYNNRQDTKWYREYLKEGIKI